MRYNLKFFWVGVLSGSICLILLWTLFLGDPKKGRFHLEYQDEARKRTRVIRKCTTFNHTFKCSLVNEPIPSFGGGADFVDVPKKFPIIRREGAALKRFRALNLGYVGNKISPADLLRKRAESLPLNSSVRGFLRSQETRRSRIEKVCKRRPNATADSHNTVTKSIVIDRLNGLTFCPIYKASSSSWLKLMLRIRGLKADLSDLKTQPLVSSYLNKITNIVAPMTTVHTTKFIVVRHPIERLVSCFRDKFEFASKMYYYKHHGELMVKAFRKIPEAKISEKTELLNSVMKALESGTGREGMEENPYANPFGPTFVEFANYIIASRREDEHWRPYYSHCNVCKMKFDFIIRFESLAEESKQFLNYLNQSADVRLIWNNPTSDGPTTYRVTCSYISQIDADLYNLISLKYALDFRLFNYDPHLYKNCTLIST